MLRSTEPANKTELFKDEELLSYMKIILKNKAFDVKITDRLENHPCVVTVQDMEDFANARHALRLRGYQFTVEMRCSLYQPCLEINPNHPLIKNLKKLTVTDKPIADRLTEQLFMNAMVSAGFDDNTKGLLISMNQLLTMILDKKFNEK